MLPFIDLPFSYLSELTGGSIDELKLVTSFLLSFPLAAILKRIPDSEPWKKNVFIIAVSIFYLIGLFDLWDGLRTLLYSAAGTYAIAYYVDGSLMPWIGFVFLMGHLSINHIYRQLLNDSSVVDITGAQMVLVMKLSSFCWNVHDGRLPQHELSDAQKYAAIRELPGILDYAGYVLFFPSLFAGPAFEYVDYRRWIETTLFEVPPGTDPSKIPATRKKRRIPRSGRPATKKLAFGLLWIFIFLKLNALYYPDTVLGPEFMKYSLPRRVWILHMLGLVTRLKYYGVWSLTEAACILSGLGYNGFDPKTGKVFWDRLENVNPWALESAQNVRAYLENWNKNTNHWLRNYVYLRVTPRGKKPGFRASLATFVTSAFWHGFYPGYYFTFVLASLIQTVAKDIRRYVRPFFLTSDGAKATPLKRYYDVVSCFMTHLVMSFTVTPFIILYFTDTILVWARVYFYGVVMVTISFAFFASPAKGFLIRRLKKRNTPLRAVSPARHRQPTLGLPSDLGREIDEAVQEMVSTFETVKERGCLGEIPNGQGLKATFETKLGKQPQEIE